MLRLRTCTLVRPVVLPSWLLVPGAAAFAASCAAFFLLKRVINFGPYDLTVYLMGGKAFSSGHPVYQQVMHSSLGIGYFTYPPVTLLIFGPLSDYSLGRVYAIMVVGGVLALWGTVWLAMRMAHFQRSSGFVGASLGIAAVALWLQPVHGTLDQGQINLLLMFLVLADFAIKRRGWPTGLLIGIAAAMKITPGIFIIYLVLTKRYRSALTAVVTWAVLTGAGFTFATRDSVVYWLRGTFSNVQRTTSPTTPGDVSNQSLNGTLARFFGDHGMAPWVLVALVVVVLGLMAGATAHRRGEHLGGVLLVAITGLLIAPVSWHEHWVWIVPVLVWIGGAAVRLSPSSPVLAGALPVVPALPFVVWPLGASNWRTTGQISPDSILGPARSMWAQGNHGVPVALAGTAYVSTGLAILVVGAILVFRSESEKEDCSADLDLVSKPRSMNSSEAHSVSGVTG